MLTDTTHAVFECRGCGHLVHGHPTGDCEQCGAGHWTSPPTYRVPGPRSSATICLCMIVKDEADTLPVTIPTFLPLIDSWTVLDTGSTDGTPDLVEALLGHLPGELHRRETVEPVRFDFGQARTDALEFARGMADWVFMPDADMECGLHPDLKAWLAGDPSPRPDAWKVPIEDNGTVWHRPLLLRGDQEWRYIGKRHEYLDTHGRATYGILGLRLFHDSSGATNGKYDEYAEALREDAESGEPRAVFYYAESLRFAGRTEEALEWYAHRAAMPHGYDEEQWYSAYQAGKLTGDVDALIACWKSRPWRHEPLTTAARLVAARGAQGDMLFLETAP